MKQHRTLLGFDYGTMRIGIAVGQELTSSSSPLDTIQNRNNKPDWTAIDKHIRDWQADGLVVGIPFNMDGTEHALTHAARHFATSLEKRYHLPVYTVDERLSSIEAQRIIRDMGISPHKLKQNKALIDQVAARLILDTYFSQHGIQHDKKCG
jgi:putative Holliday junction resolvase